MKCPPGVGHFCIRQLERKVLKSGSAQGQGYSTEFRHEAVERMNACDNVRRHSCELGAVRYLLCNWRFAGVLYRFVPKRGSLRQISRALQGLIGDLGGSLSLICARASSFSMGVRVVRIPDAAQENSNPKGPEC